MDEKDPFSERPPDSDFQQQNLKAWQPLLTPRWVIGTFLVIAVTFTALGVVIILESNKCHEYEKRYSDIPCLDGGEPPCTKNVDILIDSDMGGKDQKVYFYYKLTNFYQNHRRYVKSRSDGQLRGDKDLVTAPPVGTSPDSLSTCTPLQQWNFAGNCASDKDCPNSDGFAFTCSESNICDGACSADKKCPSSYVCDETTDRCVADSNDYRYLYPCGLIANSYFNDTFSAELKNKTGISSTISWTEEGIAWDSDKKEKFKEMEGGVNYDYYTRYGPGQYELPDVTNESFIVWMRTAGLPTFKKLRYIIEDTEFKKDDVISITIFDQFPTQQFDGEKYVVLSTTSWLGGKNMFLGYAYVIVAALCFVFAVVFSLKHCLCPRELGDMKYFSWENSRNRQ